MQLSQPLRCPMGVCKRYRHLTKRAQVIEKLLGISEGKPELSDKRETHDEIRQYRY